MLAERISEYRVGRNFIREGDAVRVDPVSGRAFVGKVTRIEDKGNTIEVSVVVKARLNGAQHPRYGMSRVVTSDRVSRLAQTKWERLV